MILNKINSVLLLRKKIFLSKIYNDYFNVINDMIIPKKFNYLNCIPTVFSNADYEIINRFEIEPFKSLYNKVEFDCKMINTLNVDENVIFVVHPFYPLIRHANFLIESKQYFDTYKNYEKEMINLLKNSKKDIILFESPDCFACYTHTFLKYKKIKKVIFTQHSYGKILNKNSLDGLKKTKNVSIAGCYKNHCLNDLIDELELDDVCYINDIIMERYNDFRNNKLDMKKND